MIDTADALTGLRQRGNFMHLLGQQIVRAGEGHARLALIVVDIDQFAQINVTHGYSFGDVTLRHLTKQLRAVARKQDHIARIGDNRFALLLSQVLNRGHVELAVQKLNRLLEAPLVVGEQQANIRVTSGAALCPEHASHAEFLLRKAETALARARRDQNEYHVLEIGRDNEPDISLQWEMEMELGEAIDRGELRMHYQPQIDIRDGQPVGAEALMRWERRNGDLVPPDVFIPMAERSGKIKKVTIWALNNALRRAGEWRTDLGPLTVSLNLPGELAIQRDLPELVENALQLWGKPNVKLMLEITERSLMDRHRGRDILLQLRELGVRISIDDFGTGYSCLAYFKNLPVDELKIDKSFVIELLEDTASLDITTLIIDLAHRFGLKVVAEGVEQRRVLEVLRSKGCDFAQGFLIGRPMPPDDFRQWLIDYRPQASTTAMTRSGT